MAAESAPGIPLELIGLVTPLPADGGPVPGEIVEHQAHAIGHAAVLLADRGDRHPRGIRGQQQDPSRRRSAAGEWLIQLPVRSEPTATVSAHIMS
jgi:hypothetical protein